MNTGARYRESRYNIWVQHGDFHYVYNGVSGAVLAVPSNDYLVLQRCLDGGGGRVSAECRPSLLADLLLGQILVNETCDEQAILAAKYKASRYSEDHLSLMIVTSLGCNFNCTYCFEDKHASIMDESCQSALLQMFDDKLPRIKGVNVEWFGGEPLIGKSALLALSDQFIKRCDRNGVSYTASIVTNGSLLNEETCLQLRERRVTNVQVTVDGPPEIHNKMRPTLGGRGTFWNIIKNLHIAVNHFNVSIRINVDRDNLDQVGELLRILRDEGFCGKLGVGLGQIIGVSDGAPAPSATYGHRCLSNPEFAAATERFSVLAEEYGFGGRPLPAPVGAPCIAVKDNGLVIGSHGELYKCYLSVGNPSEIIGNISHYSEPNGRLQKWLKYDPFSNDECRTCIALPVCMGGCAHHAMDTNLYENRCGTFRHTYMEQVRRFVEAAEPVSH